MQGAMLLGFYTAAWVLVVCNFWIWGLWATVKPLRSKEPMVCCLMVVGLVGPDSRVILV